MIKRRGVQTGTRGALFAGLQLPDYIMPLVLIAFFFSYLYIARHSVNVPDESLYLNFAHRFYLGDNPVVDEWGVEQFTGILLLIPFSIYYGVAHTTEGVIFFFRLLYAVCQILVACYIYVSLRCYGNRTYKQNAENRIFSIGALVATVVFLCFIPLSIPTLSYYAMSLMGLAVLSVTLFCYPPGKWKYFFCGVVFAAVILAEPEAILLHILLVVACYLIRIVNRKTNRKIAQHLFEDKFLRYLNFGGYTLFLLFVLFIQFRVGVRTFAGSFPHLFDGTGYVFSLKNGNIFQLNQYRNAFSFYGAAMVGIAILTILATVLYKSRKRTRPFFSILLLIFCLCALVHGFFAAFRDYSKVEMCCLYHGLPLYLSGPVWMLLAEKPDRRLCCAWFLCASFSLTFSVSSRIAVGWGGISAGIFSVMLAVQVITEVWVVLPKARKEKKQLCIILITAAAFCFTALSGELLWIGEQQRVYGVETINSSAHAHGKDFNVQINCGPLRGIFTTEAVADVYEALYEDFETINKSTSFGQCVYIHGRAPMGYLAIDRSYGGFSTWFRSDEFYRIKMYWAEHPDKIPAYIYIPYCNMYNYEMKKEEEIEDLLRDMREVFILDQTEGKAGCILQVQGTTSELIGLLQ